MNKSNDRIYIKQWLELKPYNNQAPTDGYYLKLCNEVKKNIIANKQSSVFLIYLDNDEIDALACFLTSYLEDLISETNIWNSFLTIHNRLYGKQLPFYELAEYYENEINIQDICFLIWYFMNTIQQDKFFAPFNDFIINTSKNVMEIFENEWEYAPENELLKTFYSIDEGETDFYKVRKLIDTLLFKTYLFYPDTLLDLRDKEFEILKKSKNDENLSSFLNENRDNTLFKSYTRLLGLKGQEWISEILGQNHNLSKDFLKISKKIKGYFFYKDQDEENVFLEHIASGMKFSMTKKSFDHYEKLKEFDTILYLGIVEWRNEWWFSGVYFKIEFNADLVLNEKNSLDSRMEVNFLDHQSKDMHIILEGQLKAFKEFNNDLPIAFMNSDKIESFYKGYIEFFNNSLKLTDKEKEEATQRARKDGFFGKENETKNFSEISDSGLVFFNPESGVEIALAINSAFPLKNNPYYNEEDSEEQIMSLFFAEDLSKELAMFCVNNFRYELPFFKSSEGKLLLDNIDFLLRFWKRGNYFSKPSVTFTGGKSS